jgi:hypothetical protein
MDPAKSLQGNRARPRAIVPAIPLPYIQKRKQVVAAKAGLVEHAVVVPPVAEPEVKVPLRSAVGSLSPPIVNGSSIVEADTTTNASTDAAEENAPATPATTIGGDEVKSSPNEPQDTPASTIEGKNFRLPLRLLHQRTKTALLDLSVLYLTHSCRFSPEAVSLYAI